MFQVILALNGDTSISIEGLFALERGGTLHTNTGLPLSAGSLLHLVGKSVEAADVGERGTLQIRFSDSDLLRLIDSNNDSESYEVIAPGRRIIV